MPFQYDSTIFRLPPEVQCLCTVIKNVSSAPLWILVPFHGTTIGAGQQYVFVGSLAEWAQRKRYRTRDALLKAATTGKILIEQLPVPHLTDGTVTKTLGIGGSPLSVTINDPCWKP